MAIIFDCDGVLVQSERLVSDIERVLLARWGWELNAEEIRSHFKGKSFANIAEIVRKNVGDRLPNDWMYHWAMETANGFRKRLQLVPGVRELIEQVLSRELPCCVASQSPLARVELSIGVCDLERYFEGRVFSSSMVPRPKPAPDLFLFAAKQLGVQPEDCTVIEDSPSGVRAAVAAGMRVFGYAADEDQERLAEAGAEVFFEMSEVPRLMSWG